MVLSSRRRRGEAERGTAAPLAPIQFRLEASEVSTTGADGRVMTGRGYVIADPQTGAPLGEDDFFFRIGGGLVCDLAGADSRTLQSPAFRPGRTLALLRHLAISADRPPLIDVADGTSSQIVGHLPVEVAEAVTLYGADTYQAALALWEWRDDADRRVGLRLLLAPGWTVQAVPGVDP